MAAPKRLKVSGEIIDTWYFITEIMYALGTADHRCAIWCAVGGIPVCSKNGGNSWSSRWKVTQPAANSAIKIQSHKMSVEDDLCEVTVRNLIVTQVHDDKDVVNKTHKEHGGQL